MSCEYDIKNITTQEEEIMSVLWTMLEEEFTSDDVHERGRWKIQHKHEKPKDKSQGVLKSDFLLHVEIREIVKVKLKEYLLNLENYYLLEQTGHHIKFTLLGEKYATNLVRRQRLAERLFSDILVIEEEDIMAHACEFEHIISEDVEEAICTLLGHPTECPHGKVIPPGQCCIEEKTSLEAIIKPASQLRVGEQGIIKYMTAKDNRTMHKLISLGLLPGTLIKLHQKMPGSGPMVIQIEESQIAFERSVAEDIMVQPKEEDN